MNRTHCFRGAAALMAAILLGACGGGATYGGGISGTGKPGIKVGDVASGGGLTVSGTTFVTTGAVITIEGAAAPASAIEQGQVAIVEGLVDSATGATGEAELIAVDSVVKGVLEVKLDASRVQVQGQVVQIDERTIFEAGITPASVDGLAVGNRLTIYGFVRGPGQVLATRVERSASLSEIRIVGFAQSVNATLDTFAIGLQAIDYAGADVSDLPGGDPASGQMVRVRGATTLGSLGEVVATRIDALGLEDRSNNDETEIEGFVTAVNSATEFQIGAVTVRTTLTTTFRGGLALDVVVGTRVEVEGALQGGMLDAREVKFDDAIKLESNVATVVGSTITLVGLAGISVQVDSLTEWDGDADSIVDILPGDHVEIRGRATGPSSLSAAQVKESGADAEITLQGPVDASPAPMNPILSILGVSIDTSGIADNEFQGLDEVAIGRTAFFQAVAPGVLVKIEGELVGGSPDWEEAELEGEDD